MTADVRDLIPSVAIDKLLAARSACSDAVESILARMLECDELLAGHQVFPRLGPDGSAFSDAFARGFGHRGIGISPSTAPRVSADINRALDAVFWTCVLHRSGMRSHLSARLRDEWDKACRNDKTVPFELKAVAGTFGDFLERRAQIFEDSVVEVFKHLSWQYKTNTPVAFGKRLYLARFNTNALDDLERALHVLDEKPHPDHRDSIGSSFQYLCGRKFVQTPYLAVQTYLKGSAKITFARMDLVDRLNQILVSRYPGALPAPRR